MALWVWRDLSLLLKVVYPSAGGEPTRSHPRDEHPDMRTSLQALLLGTVGVHAQLQYGNNERVTTKDSSAVAEAFPEVEGIELLSPAFLRPESTPPGWENGTDGPTSLIEMGMICSSTRRNETNV